MHTQQYKTLKFIDTQMCTYCGLQAVYLVKIKSQRDSAVRCRVY